MVNPYENEKSYNLKNINSDEKIAIRKKRWWQVASYGLNTLTKKKKMSEMKKVISRKKRYNLHDYMRWTSYIIIFFSLFY